jgi:hypothetical protein
MVMYTAAHRHAQSLGSVASCVTEQVDLAIGDVGPSRKRSPEKRVRIQSADVAGCGPRPSATWHSVFSWLNASPLVPPLATSRERRPKG